MKFVRREQRWSVQALRTSHIEICFVDRDHFDLRREAGKNLMLSPSTHDSDQDGHQRRSLAGTVSQQYGAAWRNGRRTCGLRKKRRKPPRARGAGLRLRLAFLSEMARIVLQRTRKMHPCRRGRRFWEVRT